MRGGRAGDAGSGRTRRLEGALPTNQDAHLVVRLYKEGFVACLNRIFAEGKALNYWSLGWGDDDQADLCEKYFGGGMMHQARRMMEPLADDQQSDGTSSDDADDA